MIDWEDEVKIREDSIDDKDKAIESENIEKKRELLKIWSDHGRENKIYFDEYKRLHEDE